MNDAYNTHMGSSRLRTRAAIVALLLAVMAVAADAQRRGRGRFFEPIRSPTADTFDGAFNFCRIMFSSARTATAATGRSTTRAPTSTCRSGTRS